MIRPLERHLAALRKTLIQLEPEGTGGFEGLLAAIFSHIAGTTFRLAKSGSQFGRDGTSALDGGAVSFEAKRYDGKVPKNDVISKVTELGLRENGSVDIWILGATTEVSAQDAETCRRAGAAFGIQTLVLDWTEAGLPPLATALATANDIAVEFIRAHVALAQFGIDDMKAALAAVKQSDLFEADSARISAELQSPSGIVALAREANRRWFTNAFSDRVRAVQVFGQPLTPGADNGHAFWPRPQVEGQLRRELLNGSSDSPIGILGDEGAGKSWLAAKAWLDLDEPPLLVMFTADDVPATFDDIETVVIQKLIKQTGDAISETSLARWRRRLKAWRASTLPEHPRLIVYVDGINQKASFDWARWIEGAAGTFQELGGRVAFSSRRAYYREHVRDRLISPSRSVEVPQWQASEVEAILKSRGIQTDGLDLRLINSIRNPRLLTLALELLGRLELTSLHELSVNRLLFEYLRTATRDRVMPMSRGQFVADLRSHANRIRTRLESQQRTDIGVFSRDETVGSGQSGILDRLTSVTEGRFFQPLAEDLTLYQITDEGLPLALGLSLIGALSAAWRNKQDISATLATILEPITSLDRTADIVLAAVLSACLDDECAQEVCAALIAAFIVLQNLDEACFPEFAALAKRQPEAFAAAYDKIAHSEAHISNIEWLQGALRAASEDETAWPAMAGVIGSWLSRYSLDPEKQLLDQVKRHEPARHATQRAEREAKLLTRQQEMSEWEKRLLSSALVREEGSDDHKIGIIAFTMLAGKPLAPFANALRNWAFANALNGDIHAPEKQFRNLIQFNTKDWFEAREALLSAVAPLRAGAVSRTGKWALAEVLRSTGDADDAREANALIETLTADRVYPQFPIQREENCATDPCDPGSLKPGNIGETAQKYLNLNVSTLREGRGQTIEDYFFVDARPGLARFKPDAAIEVHRRLAHDILRRTGVGLRMGVFELEAHSALLTEDFVRDCLARLRELNIAEDAPQTDKDEWIGAQELILAIFPHLPGDVQLETLLSRPGGEYHLIRIEHLLKPIGERRFEEALAQVVAAGESSNQLRVLIFARHAETPVSERARSMIAGQIASPDSLVRAYALAVIDKLNDEKLLWAVVDSGWSASALDQKENFYEVWYGSSAILMAAKRGLIPAGDALNRISFRFYGFAADELGPEAARLIAQRLDIAFQRAGAFGNSPPLLDVVQNQSREPRVRPPLLEISERPQEEDIRTTLKRLSESDEAFSERQRRNNEAFTEFERTLTQNGAYLIIDDLGSRGVNAIAAAAPEIALNWLDGLLARPMRLLRGVHNFSYRLARALSPIEPAKCAEMFARLADSRPMVRVTSNEGTLTLDGVCLWNASDAPEIAALRFAQLDKAPNDHVLASHVLEAMSCGKDALLQRYVDERIASKIPVRIARALMVCGFRDSCEHASGILQKYEGSSGLIGNAWQAANFSYERNRWARHWYDKIYLSASGQEFWSGAVLFAKIVDGRFWLWEKDPAEGSDAASRFMSSIDEVTKRRVKKWGDKRGKTLFGQEAPDAIFLSA